MWMAFNFFFAVVTEVAQNKYCSKKKTKNNNQPNKRPAQTVTVLKT